MKSIDSADKLCLLQDKYPNRIDKIERFHKSTHVKIVPHCKVVLEEIDVEIDGKLGLKTQDETSRIA